MKTYIDLLLVALVTIYVVDISGFTDSWRDALRKALKIQVLRPLPPFDCGKCMCFWACLAFAVFTGHLSLWTLAYTALLSHLSVAIGGLLVLFREWLVWLTNKLMP